MGKWLHKYLLSDGLGMLLLGIILLQLAMRFPNGEMNYRISTDVEGYYLYLPGVFIYDGFEEMPVMTPFEYQPHPHSGKYFTRFTYGVALMEAPVFLMTHLVASQGWFGAKQADGYSRTYNDGIIASNILYAVLGLYLLLLVLRRHFSRGLSWLTVLSLLWGSNYYYYVVGMVGMSHNYIFFLVAALLYYSPRLYEKLTPWQAMRLSFILGLLVLVRPTNLVFLLYPLLYQVYSFTSFGERLSWWLKRWPYLLSVPIVGCLLWIPQFCYWKVVAGAWFYNGYPVGFDHWLNPFFPEIWFSVQNGWLIYSPLMLLSLIGLGLSLKQKVFSAPVLLIMFVLFTYLFASWYVWWFGGAFGYRPMIDFYPMLALPLALLLKRLFETKLPIKMAAIGFLVLLCYYSTGLTYLYRHPWEGADWTWESFMQVLQALF
ncbi:MAG: hypothetical protein AAF927_05575 [Bacteroidota bacterium]